MYSYFIIKKSEYNICIVIFEYMLKVICLNNNFYLMFICLI